jgi:tetratricopeptide (TPR) repeat protein
MTQEALSRVNGVDSADPDQRKEGLQNLCAANTLFLEAVRYLEEAVQRYPDAVEAGAASYCIAEAYRHAAKLPGKSLRGEPTLSRRAELAQQRRDLLESAADVHLRLQTRLQEKQRQQELTAVERAILRNTYFAYADIVFDLEDYERAIKAYLAAAHRDPQDPHSLDALVQLASCYRRLNAPNEARGTLLQAKAVLARMQRDMKFEQTTRYNRENWNELIGWLAQL